MAQSLPRVVIEFHDAVRRKRAMRWLAGHDVLTDLAVLDDCFEISDLYQAVFQPLDLQHVLWAPTLDCGYFNGLLCLHRSQRYKPFGNHDRSLVGHLTSYLAHALAINDNGQGGFCEKGESGMIVMNGAGKTRYRCPEAERLLTLARYPRLLIDARSEDRLQAKLAQLCRDLQAVYRGDTVLPPSYSHGNAHGLFLFRAYRLTESDLGGGDMIGLTVEHREPLKLKILRGLRHQPLSPAQKEVALQLAQGEPFESIGKRLNIKPTTVKDHVRKIYTKLDIRQRDQLLPKLMAPAT